MGIGIGIRFLKISVEQVKKCTIKIEIPIYLESVLVRVIVLFNVSNICDFIFQYGLKFRERQVNLRPSVPFDSCKVIQSYV